mmetsp:Transcript_10187/g.24371  ORF Transcript_10187/g.24371 Transcript_10187/m.24371 type:complete len:274 (+) Transcript_10187:246-1067(+)
MSTEQGAVQNKIQNLHNLQFPWKLHRLLEEADLNGDSTIVSWLPGNKAFKVHNRQEFANRIMPAYFSSAKYKTFQRSLNLWGFESVSKGRDKGACFHKFFVRGHPNLCENMRRVKIKGQQATKANKETSIPALPNNNGMISSGLISAEPNISDFIRNRRTSLDTSGSPQLECDSKQQQQQTPHSALSLYQSDMLLKAAIERQRREALLRLQLQTQLPGLNFGGIPNILQQAQAQQNAQNNAGSGQQQQQQQQQDPLQTVALAAALASKVIHEV